jgi:hypothetical protein
MHKRTVFLALAAVAPLVVATAGCSGAQATDDAPSSTTAAASSLVTHRRVLAAGAVLDLRSAIRITSASNHAGDPVSATFASAARTPGGDEVIPVGAVLSGSITRIAESGSPSSPGTLELVFGTLTIGARNYPIHVAVTSLATHKDAAGVTTEDAAKVAVGAAAGGIAGRLIGGNRTGTLIGAGAGAVGGAVYANRTRQRDIVLSSGAAIGAVLSGPFTR